MNMLRYFGLIILCCVWACTPQQVPTGTSAPQSQEAKAPKTAYMGIPKIFVDTGLQTPEGAQVIQVSADSVFQLQSAAEPVLSQNIVLDEQGQFTFAHTLQNEPQTRYQLQIQPEDSDAAAQVSLKINDQPDITDVPLPFAQSTVFQQSETQLLFVFEGEPGQHIQLTLTPAGQAGTVFSRQQGHAFQWPQPLPASLQALQPHQGDRLLGGTYLAAVQFNDSPPTYFEAGTLIIQFTDDTAGLALMQERY